MKTFDPTFLGSIELSNKIVMAPLTRCRAINNVPNELMKTYYSQRATAGLIISEGTSPSPNGLGYARMPGAYTESQILGWKSIAEGIHENGGKFYIQLMHAGRVASQLNLPKDARIISPSGVHLDSGEMYTDAKGFQPHDIPEEMTIEDIVETKNEFISSARKLIDAGIDGIELHAANGYLLEQFLNPKTNLRTDEYGGNYKNRARFILELAHELILEIGSNKIGIRFSPYGVFNDMQGDYDDLVEMYTYLAEELNAMGISYIHIVDQTVAMSAPEFATDIKRTIRNAFKNAVIVGGNVHTLLQVENHLNEGYDLVYIGRPFISNPTLVEKLKNNETLTEPNYDTFYTPDAVGYTDYA